MRSLPALPGWHAVARAVMRDGREGPTIGLTAGQVRLSVLVCAWSCLVRDARGNASRNAWARAAMREPADARAHAVRPYTSQHPSGHSVIRTLTFGQFELDMFES